MRSLPASFSNVKEHIRQEAADILCDIKETKDIGDFIKELKTFFKTNGHLQEFTTVSVPTPAKKNLSANKADIKENSKEENPEKMKNFNKLYEKAKVKTNIEKKFKDDLIAEVNKVCNDSNSTTALGSLQEYKDFCKKNKNTACFCCLSINCLKRQRCSKEAKIKKTFNKKCSQKQLTLGEVKAMSGKKEDPKPDEGNNVITTASFQLNDEGEDKKLSSMVTEMFNNEDEIDSTFDACMADVVLNKPISLV